MEIHSDIFRDEDRVIRLIMRGALPKLMVYNERNEKAQIRKRMDDGDYVINLFVSSFSKKALYACVIKTRFLC